MRLKVQGILEKHNISYRIIELEKPAITVKDVIKFSKQEINPEEICKTILIKHKQEFFALLLKGTDLIDFNKLKSKIGKSSIASRDEVFMMVGVEPGAVCPILVNVPVLVDCRVFELVLLNFSSGNKLYGVEINSNDLIKVLNYEIVDLAKSMR